jgi:hypothetical protein
MDWARRNHNIHDKVMQWFTVIGKELQDPAIVRGNVDNMDETGVLHSVLRSLEVLEELVLHTLLQIEVG